MLQGMTIVMTKLGVRRKYIIIIFWFLVVFEVAVGTVLILTGSRYDYKILLVYLLADIPFIIATAICFYFSYIRNVFTR